MMPTPNDTDLTFLTEAMTHMGESLDMQKSLVQTFDFLEQHFPVEAISLQQYSSSLQSFKLLFLVRKGKFDFVELTVPLPEHGAGEVFLHDSGIDPVRNYPDYTKTSVGQLHSDALASYVPLKPRAYLLAILQSSNETLGQLCLMGTRVNCFTREHERKLGLLVTPFSLAMSNLLKHKRTLEFQKRLHEENLELHKGLQLMRDKRVIGDQGGLKETMEMVYQLQGREIPALILGETGTGKELIAEVIQKISPRKDAPFVKVNCGAIPEALLDSELFGHEKGAFTGATSSKPGRFEQADGGTLFLDEVGELTLQAQVRLLRALQSSEIQRVGSTRSLKVDVRVIAATNRDLELMMQEGAFREDLYYRLNVFPIRVPPLRERTQDIAEMVHLFLKRACRELDIPTLPALTSETVKKLLQYAWPGNVRELENLVKRGVTLYREGPLLLDELLPRDAGWYIAPGHTGHNRDDLEKLIDARVERVLKQHLAKLEQLSRPGTPATRHVPEPEPHAPGLMTLEAATKGAILAALNAAHGRVKGPGGAAELLDINPSTLRGKMGKLGITSTPT